ncbi:hypothetical protein ONS95_010854 [Cadophora gregata]|uniref:uncharacterized protein n=1 Tax=Cadophora gregata TaxID=51156 RepID=UPI0026DCB74B|nr:uncharacterized protein ONS95_010854 [Cadophora gregata]KAK0119402.1 hypothetical protein ONS95_010854 [Cadophora gregata]
MMHLPWLFKYAAISNFDVSEDSDKEDHVGFVRESSDSRPHRRLRSTRTLMILGTTFNIIIFSLSLLLFFSSRDTGRNFILKKSSFYSPILDKFNLPTFVQQINGTLLLPKEPSIARQDPNPEADAIWEDLELIRTIVITGDEVKKLGKDPATAARFDNEYWGLGDDAYMAQIDVFHQLHCLNELRKLTYPDYYHSFPNSTSQSGHDHAHGHHARSRYSKLWQIHIGHCVDILMQNIMCNANTDLITLQWMEKQDNPFPDFSINHQCRDFNVLADWRDKNAVDMNKWDKMKKPVGVKEVPLPQEHWESFGGKGDD